MNTTNNTVQSPINLWPISIISFFTIAIIGCGTFIAFCTRHPADLISPNYYEQEVKYQGQIDRLRHTQARASAASVQYDNRTRSITVSVPVEVASANASGQSAVLLSCVPGWATGASAPSTMATVAAAIKADTRAKLILDSSPERCG